MLIETLLRMAGEEMCIRQASAGWCSGLSYILDIKKTVISNVDGEEGGDATGLSPGWRYSPRRSGLEPSIFQM